MLHVLPRFQPPPRGAFLLRSIQSLVALVPLLVFWYTPLLSHVSYFVLRDSAAKSFQVGALGAGRRRGGSSRTDRRQAGRDDETNGEDGGGEEDKVPGAGQVGW